MNKIKIAPSILSADFANMGKGITQVEEWGADYIHCDVMDGVFVPNITFGMPMIKALRPYSKLPFDVHLMIINPEKFIDAFIDSGADIITFHPDVCSNIKATLKRIRDNGVKAGLVINPDVKVNVIKRYIEYIDIVLLMGVYPGFGGQKFIESVYDKISEASNIIGNRQIELEIDGGVTESNIDEMIKRGINVVVGGSSIFKSSNPKKTIRRLRGCIKQL